MITRMLDRPVAFVVVQSDEELTLTLRRANFYTLDDLEELTIEFVLGHLAFLSLMDRAMLL